MYFFIANLADKFVIGVLTTIHISVRITAAATQLMHRSWL